MTGGPARSSPRSASQPMRCHAECRSRAGAGRPFLRMENNHPLNPLIRSRAASVQSEKAKHSCHVCAPHPRATAVVEKLPLWRLARSVLCLPKALDAWTRLPVRQFGLQPRPSFPTRVRRVLLNELGDPDRCMPHGESELSPRRFFGR